MALRIIRLESGPVQGKMKTFSLKPQKNGCQGQPLVQCDATKAGGVMQAAWQAESRRLCAAQMTAG
jgi:hypothetical protein